MFRFQPLLPILLQRSTVKIVPKPVGDLSPAELNELYQLSTAMAPETKDHWMVHVESQQDVHMYQSKGGLVGFQFWGPRVVEGDLGVIRGGKLRVTPAVRGKGVPSLSGLIQLQNSIEADPQVKTWLRLSLASLKGYNSIRSSLDHIYFLNKKIKDPNWHAILHRACQQLCEQSQYQFDPSTSLVSVGIKPESVELTPAFLQRPAVKEFETLNPDWRSNEKYLISAWDFDEKNITSLLRYIDHRLISSHN